jgi:hypothetical protein
MEDAAGQKSRSPKTAALLAALPGLVCCLGIGHLYAGRMRRGLLLLLGGWGLAGGSLFCLTAWSMCHLIIPPLGQPIGEPPAAADVFLGVGVVSFLGLVSLWAWQIFDARRCARSRPASQGQPPAQ